MAAIKKKIILIGNVIVIFEILLVIIIIVNAIALVTTIFKNRAETDLSALNGLPFPTEIVVEAVESSEKNDIPVSIILGQLILESGTWENMSELAKRDKNLFGIKYYGNGKEGVDFNYWSTREEGQGVVRAKFCKFKTYKECFDKHGEVLKQNRYIRFVSDRKNADLWAEALQKGGYATDLSYSDKLKSVMRDYNLYALNGKSVKAILAMLNSNAVGELVGNEKQDNIVKTALSYKDPYHNGYRGMCEAWVAEVYRKSGLTYSGSCCASEARRKFAKKAGKIPVGAVIYSGENYRSNVYDSVCGKNAGHVAIYVGNNQVAGSQIPFVMSLDDWKSVYGYGGWSFNVNNIKK